MIISVSNQSIVASNCMANPPSCCFEHISSNIKSLLYGTNSTLKNYISPPQWTGKKPTEAVQKFFNVYTWNENILKIYPWFRSFSVSSIQYFTWIKFPSLHQVDWNRFSIMFLLVRNIVFLQGLAKLIWYLSTMLMYFAINVFHWTKQIPF